MAFSLTIPAYVLSGNAVLLHVTGSALADYSYTVKDSGGNAIYSGISTGLEFDISLKDVVETLVSAPDPKAMAAVTDIFAAVTGFVAAFSVEVTSGTETHTASSKVVYGGIPKRLVRELSKSGTNIFADRFLNPAANFLLTTRSGSTEILVKETELFPILMLPCFSTLVVKTGGTTIATYNGQGAAPTTAYQLNIDLLRKQYFTASGMLCNRFELYTDGGYACAISIIESDGSGRSLLFQNSLGAYEKLEVAGKITYKPELAEDGAYLAYDKVTDSFTKERLRPAGEEKYVAEIGYDTPARRLWCRDLIGAKDCYLINGSDWYRGRVSADAQSLAETKPEAVSVNVNLTLVDSEFFFSGDLIDDYIVPLSGAYPFYSTYTGHTGRGADLLLGAVRYDIVQSLTSDQKARAISNLGLEYLSDTAFLSTFATKTYVDNSIAPITANYALKTWVNDAIATAIAGIKFPSIPDTSGFITSAALAAYVPYTGATKSVNLGDFSLTAKSITIGGILADIDANGDLLFHGNIKATGSITARATGASSGGGSGSGLIQNVYGYSDLLAAGDATYSDAVLTDTFNAYAIYKLRKRIDTIESGAALNLSTAGSGNVIVSLSKSGNTLIATYGQVQAQLNGTGLVRISGTTVSYDNSAYITGITSAMVTGALGFIPYNSSNPSGFISGITSGMVTAALGFIPYNSTNPAGYITATALSPYVPYTGATGSVNLGNYSLTTKTITIGSILADIDANGDLLFHGNIKATGSITARATGASSGGGSGSGLIQNVYGYSDLLAAGDATYSDAVLTDAFNAYSIYRLRKRIDTIESGAALNLSTAGSGNVIASLSKSGNTLIATYGQVQAQLNGTGLVRMSGTTVSYDNSAYITASALSGYATQSWVIGNCLGINATASTATKLSTPRTITINGFANTTTQTFDGSSNLTIGGVLGLPTIITTLTSGLPTYGNCMGMVNATDSPTGSTAWGRFIQLSYYDNSNNAWQTQFFQPGTTGDLYIRSQENGNLGANFGSWYRFLNSGNYNLYALPLTGGTITGPLRINASTNTMPFETIIGGKKWQFGQNAGAGTSDDSFSLYSATYGNLNGYIPVAVFTNSGSLLIGTTNENGSKLYVNGTGYFASNLNAYQLLLDGSSYNIYTYARVGLPNAGRIIYNNGTGSNLFFGELSASKYGFTSNTATDQPTLAMDIGNVRVGIGTNSPAFTLHVNGSGYFNGNITASGSIIARAISDIRLKNIIKPVTGEEALRIIDPLNFYQFTYNDIARRLNPELTKLPQFGAIAQEVAVAMPGALQHFYGDKYLGVDYQQFIPLLAAIIKYQQVQINELKSRI